MLSRGFHGVFVVSGSYAAVAVLLVVLAGCSSENLTSPLRSIDGAGGSGTGAGGSMAGAGGQHDVQTILPDSTGRVDVASTGSTGIQGAWFAYSDGVGFDGTSAAGDCEWLGRHQVSECSQIVTPAFGSFPNTAGKMCTDGVVAQEINVVGESTPDYTYIWGGGIGLGLNATGVDPKSVSPYNAVAHQLMGIAFDIDTVPAAGIRVELTSSATTTTPAFWGGDVSFTSPVQAGHNELYWASVKGPPDSVTPPVIDPTHIFELRFHVSTNAMAATNYSFCIANLAVIF